MENSMLTRFLILLGALVLPAQAIAQDAFKPGLNITDTNPAPEKAMCWTGGAWAPCGVGNPMQVQGQPWPTGASANQIQGTGQSGNAPVGNPNFIAGWDGTFLRALLTDTSGRQLVITGGEGLPADTPWTGTGSCTVIACLKFIGTGPTPSGSNTIGRVFMGPDAAAVAAIAPVTVVNVNAQLAKAAAGNLYSLNVDNAAVTGTYAVLYNAAAVPTAGATLTSTLLLWHFLIGSGASLDKTWPVPVRCTLGCVVLYTTSLSTYTVPATAPLASTVMVQ
jgi:hypothetical protein